jgi:hypothetical protein
LNHIINFDGYAANGAFQLMNPLTRLAHGQIIGRDFQFFHGSGVALVHYPIFAFFGKGLFGSEMSRWFTSIILFIISSLIFCRLWFANKKSTAHVKSVFAFVVAFALTESFSDAITPSNSLLGVRTTLPLIIGSLFLIRPQLTRRHLHIAKVRISFFNLSAGILLSLAVLCGTEHGIAAIIAFSLIELLIVIRSCKQSTKVQTAKVYFRNIVQPFSIMIMSLAILSTAISYGHPWRLLRYNLITVPTEQFWYFGADPQGFLQITLLPKQLADPTMITLYVFLLATTSLMLLAKKMRLLDKNQKYAAYFLTSYGIITMGSLLGYFTPIGQLVGIFRMLIIIDSVIAVALVSKLLTMPNSYYRFASALFISLFLAQILNMNIRNLEYYPVGQLLKNTYHNIRGDHSTLLGIKWQNRIAEFKPYIDEAKKQGVPYPLWSTYSSLYEQQSDIVHPSSEGCDYIIHCLGDKMRLQYVDDFKKDKPELVTTLQPSYFGFEEWLWARHAEFFESLVANYTIVASNDSHILWKRRKQALAHNSAEPRQLAIIHNSVELPSSQTAGTQIIEISVKYRTDPYLDKIPGVSKLPRYMVRLQGTQTLIAPSLPSNRDSWKFLLVLKSKTSVIQTMRFSAEGLLPATISVSSVSYRPIDVDIRQLSYFTEQSVFQASP